MATLEYEGKQSKDEILERARAVQSIGYCERNILFHGDNFIGLSMLLPSFSGKIDLIYIDPPFNTQCTFYSGDGFVRTVGHEKGAVAYEDCLDTDAFLEFIRERLILMRELLSERGTIYLHIDCKMGHYIKIVMDEVFGRENFMNDIARIKCHPKNFRRRAYGNMRDMILVYSKKKGCNIWNDITQPLSEEELNLRFDRIDENGKRYCSAPLHAPGVTNGATSKPWRGIYPPKGRHWSTDPSEFDRLDAQGDIVWSSNGVPRVKHYADDFKGDRIQDIWDMKDPMHPSYPTGKNRGMLDRIVLQSSMQGSLVLDCFAGGGTTLLSAQSNGRRWIGMDSSSVAIRTIKNTVGCDLFMEG